MFKTNLVVALVCGLALTAWSETASAQELFVDGGFESGAFPPSWRSVALAGEAPTITSNPDEVYEGTYAAVITKTDPLDYTLIDDYTTEPTINPGDRLRLSYAVKRLSGDENSELRVAFIVTGLGGSWNIIHDAPNEFSWVATNPGTDWSVVEYETTVPNDDFQYTNVYVAWAQTPEDSAPGGTPYLGTFAIDSISAIVLPPGLGLDGDYNEDEVVDAADYVLWRKNVGQPLGTLPNDSTSADPIDGTQRALWQTNFGSSSGGGGASVVPEPTCLLHALAACAMGLVFANTRCQRRATKRETLSNN